jgi:tetratricopeptide (TPR) repeat protein
MNKTSLHHAVHFLPGLLVLFVLVAGCRGGRPTASPTTSTPLPPQSVGTPQAGGNVAASVAKGQAALEAGKLPEAEKAFRDAANLDPGSAEAQFGLGNVYLRQGQLDAAETAYRAAVNNNPDMNSAHLNLGVVYYQKEELTKAADEFNAVLRIDPNDAQALYLLAAVRIQEKQLTEAEKLLDQAKAGPAGSQSILWLRCVGFREKAEAIAAFEKFLSLALRRIECSRMRHGLS